MIIFHVLKKEHAAFLWELFGFMLCWDFFFHSQLVVTWKIFIFFPGEQEASLHLLAEFIEKIVFYHLMRLEVAQVTAETKTLGSVNSHFRKAPHCPSPGNALGAALGCSSSAAALGSWPQLFPLKQKEPNESILIC